MTSYYGQAEAPITQDELDENTDKRGVISKGLAEKIRALRASEQWERYDTIVVGPNASRFSRGWFDSWQDFTAADRLTWFSGREANVGLSYTNQPTERTDWAQDIHQTTIEFIPPPGIADLDTDSNDSLTMPILFSTEVANQMGFTITLAESDEIAKAPGSHFPAGFGVEGMQIAAASSPAVFAGNNGQPHISNAWRWPEPVMLAAKAKITVTALLDSPIKDLFRQLPGPGNKLVPIAGGATYTYPNWYRIRVTHRGPRYLQLRGARSAQ